ncbi:MAG TPA: Xaa-Pro peptidase family protein [Armatimonadota bacterium]|jgi:Xaa-Pro aminopeptidase
MVTETDNISRSQVYEGFPAEEFTEHRARVLDALGAHAHAVLQGAGPVRGFEQFRQTNEFFHLTGVDVPQCYLLLDGGRRSASLYLPSRGSHPASEGTVLGSEDAVELQALTGVDHVFDLDALASHIAEASVIFTPHSPAEGRRASRDELLRSAKAIAADPWDSDPSREEKFIGALRARAPRAEIRDLSPILDGLRLVKSPREVGAMRRAGALSALAVKEAMRSTQPGVMEYQLGAIADYLFEVNGAQGTGYRAIIAGGRNIWYSHYFRNNCPLLDGDLVLMDYAPDIDNYTSDIGRMWPVNGTYSPLQCELYGFIVKYHKAVLRHLRPGVMPSQVLREAADEMRPVIDETTFSKPIYEAAARRCLDFKGHLSHPVGMAVHDVASYLDRPFEPGITITVDPQMWIPEEQMYIRVEDSVAITDTGVEVLTGAAPLELDDVEELMHDEGMLQRYPALSEPLR